MSLLDCIFCLFDFSLVFFFSLGRDLFMLFIFPKTSALVGFFRKQTLRQRLGYRILGSTLGPTPIEGKGRKWDWGEGEIRKWCKQESKAWLTSRGSSGAKMSGLAHLKLNVSALYPSQISHWLWAAQGRYDLGKGHLSAAKVLFQGLTAGDCLLTTVSFTEGESGQLTSKSTIADFWFWSLSDLLFYFLFP